MGAFTYFQHGRRHHPRKGTDPILGLAADLPMASLRATTGAPPTIAGDNAQHYISLQHGSGALFYTDPDWADIFENASTTAFTGSAVWGLSIKQAPATYRYEWFASPTSGGTAGAVYEAYWGSTGTAILSNWQQGRTKTTIDDTWDNSNHGRLFWTEYQSMQSVSDGPWIAVPWARLASGSSITLDISLIVTQINATYNPQL